MKALALATGLMAGFFMPALAIEPPDDVQPRVVQIQLYCVPTMSRMAEIISDTWGESGVVVMEMSATTTITIFTNEDHTSTSVVVSRTDKNETEHCLAWSGTSPDGFGFVVNPEPIFPEKKPDGTET